MIRPISDLLWSPFSPFPPRILSLPQNSPILMTLKTEFFQFQMVSMTRETREGTKKVKQTQDKEWVSADKW